MPALPASVRANMGAKSHKYQLKSLSHGLEVLAMLSRQDYALTELSTELQLPVSNVHRLVSTLEAYGFADQDPKTRKYRMGSRAAGLIDGYFRNQDTRSRIRPILQQLAAESGATAHLAVLSGISVMYLDTLESSSVVYVRSSIGTQLPLACTAIGQVLLAYATSALLDAALSLTRSYTSLTVTDRSELLNTIQRIRLDGYAVSVGQYREDVIGVASPIVNYDHQVTMAIGILLPNMASVIERLGELANLVRLAGDRASVALGAGEIAAAGLTSSRK